MNYFIDNIAIIVLAYISPNPIAGFLA